MSASLVHLFTVPRSRVYANQDQFMLNLKTASRSPPIKIGNEHETKLIQRYWSKTFSLISMLLIKPQSKAKIKKPKKSFASLVRWTTPCRYSQFFGSEPLVAPIWLEARRLNLKLIRGHQKTFFFLTNLNKRKIFAPTCLAMRFSFLRCGAMKSRATARQTVLCL